MRSAGMWLMLLALSSSACRTTHPDGKPQTPASKRLTQNPLAKNHGAISSISIEQFFALQQAGQAMIFDARPSYFYHREHIPGAISLHAEDCDPLIASLSPGIQRAVDDGQTLVVYCSGFGCRAARTLSRHLSRAGFPVSVFSGGIDKWKQAGLPLKSMLTQQH